MALALGGVCVEGGKFCCSEIEYFASTNTLFFFSIYIAPIAVAEFYVPWAYSSRRQLLSMQHSVLLFIECMRLLPELHLPRVTLLVFRWMLIFTFFLPC